MDTSGITAGITAGVTPGDASGALDEALERLHGSGPERLGRLTNHAPMAVEALAARGQARSVHRWLDLYAPKLEEFPTRVEPVTDADWRAALGDPRRVADWIGYFGTQVAERPWREVLAQWWPRLLPGMYGGSTHPVIRVGHAVRTLLAAEAGTTAPAEPRVAELAHGLGYWAARHHPVTVRALPGAGTAAEALDAVPLIAEQDGGFPTRLARVSAVPEWAAEATSPADIHARLTELVRTATHRYATHGHGEETMLVHAATAPNAVLRTLPALPHDLWQPSLQAAWTASAAVTAMYAPATGVDYTPPGTFTAEEVMERALSHGDEHVIKLTDTALDVGDEQALAAALRAIELSAPLV
ncbi:questin oxidase family protein [Streptomyces sp. TRM66268-LWL]|uniref:Questin oxidase family protein n=1 Tax=Streptomyces polyasparticus TaxID=2767826 RepID=A0ABR7S9X7_9ACTN|nr:questin oxidase family protein [Streptomyces polyasparticus]MBC9711143.1 questin oxidase family protein [Streptomyces polyasparticus]